MYLLWVMHKAYGSVHEWAKMFCSQKQAEDYAEQVCQEQGCPEYTSFKLYKIDPQNEIPCAPCITRKTKKGKAMNRDQLKRKMIEGLDEILSHRFVVRGEKRELLQANKEAMHSPAGDAFVDEVLKILSRREAQEISSDDVGSLPEGLLPNEKGEDG